MKITFVLPGIWIAGGISSTLELANRFHDKGHQVTVVYPLIPGKTEKHWYDFKIIKNCVISLLRSIKRGNKVNWFELRAKLVRVPLMHHSFLPPSDILVATWWADAYIIDKYKYDNCRKFYFIRHYETWGGDEELVNKSYQLPLTKIVTSTWLKNTIENKFGVSVIGPLPNGIDLSVFYKTENKIPNISKKIGLLYRKDRWKGMETGLKALSLVKKTYPDVKIALFGDVPIEEDRRMIHDIGEVEFYKLPYKDKLREIYNSLDIFVFPSYHEGFGRPPMEAMACGTAVVTTNVGAIPDYAIPGKTALIIPPHDINSLVDCIKKLIDDDNTRLVLAENAYNHIKKFSWDTTVDKLENIFLTS